jgi:hypothetical protein
MSTETPFIARPATIKVAGEDCGNRFALVE